MKIKRICQRCKGPFEADHWNVARGKAHFCSRYCVYEWLSEERSGKKMKAKAKKPN